MQNRSLNIGALAKQTGLSVQTIRHYEQIGLLPEPARSASNQRQYNLADAERLGFIRHGRALGFSLPVIRELLSLADQPKLSCGTADLIAQQHLSEVRERLRALKALERELQKMVHACAGGQVADCHVISVLANHQLCQTEIHDEAAFEPVPVRRKSKRQKPN